MVKTEKNRVQTPSESSYKIKKSVILALICAMAYVLTMVCRISIIPSAPFLDLEFKSAVILIGSYIFGPLSGLAMSAVICLLEMVTFSSTGIIGCIMNIIATVCFVCPAALVYKKRKTTVGAIVGILIGAVLMTGAMVLWNYLITPIYQGIPREAIVPMLLPVFVPFNLLKAALNGGAALAIYQPASRALEKANLIPKTPEEKRGGRHSVAGAAITSAFVILSCIMIILAINGVF